MKSLGANLKLENRILRITCDGGVATVSQPVLNLSQKNLIYPIYQAVFIDMLAI